MPALGLGLVNGIASRRPAMASRTTASIGVTSGNAPRRMDGASSGSAPRRAERVFSHGDIAFLVMDETAAAVEVDGGGQPLQHSRVVCGSDGGDRDRTSWRVRHRERLGPRQVTVIDREGEQDILQASSLICLTERARPRLAPVPAPPARSVRREPLDKSVRRRRRALRGPRAIGGRPRTAGPAWRMRRRGGFLEKRDFSLPRRAAGPAFAGMMAVNGDSSN